MEIVPYVGSKPSIGSEVQLFELPRTDMSIKEKRFQDYSPLSDSLSPMEFLIPATDTFIDLNRSYFSMDLRLEKRNAGNTAWENLAAADNLFPTINLPHTMTKQCTIKWNGVLLNPQTDTYSIRAYFATVMNYTPEEGASLLAPEGWFPIDPISGYVPLDAPAEITTNNLNNTTVTLRQDSVAHLNADLDALFADGIVNFGHDDYKALSNEQKAFVRASKAEKKKFDGGKWHTFFFKPMHEVFYMHRLLPPGIEQRYEFTFHPAKYYLNGVGVTPKELHKDDVNMKFHLCIVMVDAPLYKQITAVRHTQRHNIQMATIRSECRVFTIPANVQEFNEDNLFQGRIPQHVVVGLLEPEALNGHLAHHPFAFQNFGMESIKQLIHGEEYSYRTLQLNYNNNEKDMAGYHRFLQAGGFFARVGASMITPGMWGDGRNCTLFAFDNTASGNLDGPFMNPKQKGNVRLILKLGAAINHPISVVIYAQFEAVLTADPNGAILYDIYS